jgi:hypothetical protein
VAEKTFIGTVNFGLAGIPIGYIKFKVMVQSEGRTKGERAVPVSHIARRYRRAFISCVSKDRTEVLKRVQMLGRGYELSISKTCPTWNRVSVGNGGCTGTSTIPICFCCSRPTQPANPSES